MTPEDALARISRRLPSVRGKSALAQRLRRRAEKRGTLEGAWHVRLRDGTVLDLPRQSLMSWAVAFQGFYDPAAMSAVGQFGSPDSLVLDVGASLGIWTVPLGLLAASRNAHVWAFEPNPANAPWINRNVALNHLDEAVTLREMGLGDAQESVTLVGSEYGVGNGAIALRQSESTAKHPRVEINIGRLDDLDLPGRVSFIKIDTEGYEVAFLRGASATIARDRPVIFGEFAAGWLERRGEDLRAALLDLDYDVAALTTSRSSFWRTADTPHLEPIDLSSSTPLPDNLLLRPR